MRAEAEFAFENYNPKTGQDFGDCIKKITEGVCYAHLTLLIIKTFEAMTSANLIRDHYARINNAAMKLPNIPASDVAVLLRHFKWNERE